MKKKLSKFFLIISVINLSIWVNLLLGIMNFKTLVKIFKPRILRGRRVLTLEEIYQVSYKVLYTSIFGYLIFRPTCLRKSLVLYRIFHKRGYSVAINLGVKKESETVTAHSWLTLDGEPLFENAEILQEYKLIYNYL